MGFCLVYPLLELLNVHRRQLRNVLVPDAIRQRFAVKACAVTLRTLSHSEELVSPFLSGLRVVVLHDGAQILDDTVERAEVVARCAHHVLADAYRFERTVQHLVERVLRYLAHRRLQRTFSRFENGSNLPEYHLVLVLAQRNNGALVYRQRVVGDDLLHVNLVDIAQALALAAGTLGRVEREHIRCRVAVRDARRRAHQSLGEVLCHARVLVENHNLSVALAHCRSDSLAQAVVEAVAHLHLVYHHLNVMVLVAVGLHAASYLRNLSVDAHVEIALATKCLEEFAVVALALPYECSEYVYALAGIVGVDHLDDALLRILHHLLARNIAVSGSGASIEQTQIVVYLGRCAHGRAWVLVCCLLFDGYNRTKTGYVVDIGALHSAKEVACVCRERVDVSALTFGVYRVEGKRRLARSAQSGDYRERVAWYLHVNVLQVVDACAPNVYLFSHRELRILSFEF